MFVSELMILVENYQQMCVNEREEVVEEFLSGNVGQFINNGILNIPCGVKYIGKQIYEYEGKDDIIEVNIPDSVVYIGQSSFGSCRNLTDVTMGDSLIKITSYTFSGCNKLQNIKISNSVTYIGTFAFCDCEQLKEINLPDSLIYIDSWAFSGSGLTSIIIPNSVQEIGSGVFENCQNLEYVILSSQLKVIQWYTFQNCSKLQNLVIPQSINQIEQSAFYNCTSLKCVAILNKNCQIHSSAFNNTQFSSNYNSLKNSSSYCIDNTIYYNCIDLQKQYIYNLNTPDICIKEDYVYLYYVNNQQQNIVVSQCPEDKSYMFIDETPYQCIQSCDSPYYQYDNICTQDSNYQESIYSKFNYKTLDNFVSSNGTLTIPDGIEVITSDLQYYENKNNIRNIQFSSSVLVIGEDSFSFYRGIKQIIIPDNIQMIDDTAFSYCENLVQVQFNNNISILYGWLFSGCTNLQTVTGLQNIKQIYNGVFCGCNNLKYIDTSNKLIYIGVVVFQNCYNLQIMDISQVTYIGYGAFDSCSSITHINLPQITQIQQNTFCNCTNLQFVNIPKSVISVEYRAFNNCTSLQCIAIMNKNCNINETAFQNTSFETSYTDYVGEDKRCFEEGYNYCNQTNYDYIVDINDLLTCTTIDNVDYYYKTEIDEEEVNVRVENCEQINYQYQIQGIPIECVENCGDLYIQEQYCVTECSEEYPLIQDKYCVIQCSQNYQLQNNECIPQDINQNPNNNNLGLILGIIIPVILVIIITITVTIFVCRKKKHQNTQDKNTINKQKQNQQKLNEEQKLTGIIKSDNLKPINIELQDQQNYNHFNNQILSPTQKKYEFKYRKQNL